MKVLLKSGKTFYILGNRKKKYILDCLRFLTKFKINFLFFIISASWLCCVRHRGLLCWCWIVTLFIPPFHWFFLPIPQASAPRTIYSPGFRNIKNRENSHFKKFSRISSNVYLQQQQCVDKNWSKIWYWILSLVKFPFALVGVEPGDSSV